MNDIVTLDICTYNTLKSEAVKANMIVDHLFRTAHYQADDNQFRWDEVRLNEVLEIVYPKRFANKLAEIEEQQGENT